MGFKYRKRTFLAPTSTGTTSYIFAEVESSQKGEYKFGTNMLTLADCRRHIELEFFLGTKKARRESLAKLDTLVQTLISFGQALNAELELIEQYEKIEGEKNGRSHGRAKKSRKNEASKRIRKASEETDQERISS